MTEPVPSSHDSSPLTPLTNRRKITIIVILAIAAGILVLALLRPWIPEPSNVIKETRARTSIITSCLMSAVGTETLSSGTRLTMIQGSYSVPFRASLEVTQEDIVQEYIHIGNVTYVKMHDTNDPIIQEGLLSDLFIRGPHAIVNSLAYLTDIQREIDQRVDDIPCYHYTASFLAPADIDSEIRAGMHPLDNEFLIDLYNRSTTTLRLDIWISKNDSLLRQVRAVVRSAATRDTVSSTTLKLYDFNQDVTIEPPLADETSFLPGWGMYER